MNVLHYTLISDGPSDQVLLPILDWLLRAGGFVGEVQARWVDPRPLPGDQRSLQNRIQLSLEYQPCDLLFIHRDAEKEPREARVSEIKAAIEAVDNLSIPPAIYVIPVRMTEAWLLFDEAAICQAAANPHGRQPLQLPELSTLEQGPDPKEELYALLRTASGLPKRRLKKFRPQKRIYAIADRIRYFSPLRALAAFSTLETDVLAILQQQHWV